MSDTTKPSCIHFNNTTNALIHGCANTDDSSKYLLQPKDHTPMCALAIESMREEMKNRAVQKCHNPQHHFRTALGRHSIAVPEVHDPLIQGNNSSIRLTYGETQAASIEAFGFSTERIGRGIANLSASPEIDQCPFDTEVISKYLDRNREQLEDQEKKLTEILTTFLAVMEIDNIKNHLIEMYSPDEVASIMNAVKQILSILGKVNFEEKNACGGRKITLPTSARIQDMNICTHDNSFAEATRSLLLSLGYGHVLALLEEILNLLRYAYEIQKNDRGIYADIPNPTKGFELHVSNFGMPTKPYYTTMDQFDLGEDCPVKIITGGNGSGKSEFLMRLAQIILRVRKGRKIPCERASISWPGKIFHNFSVKKAENMGELEAQLIPIAQFLKENDPHSICLTDEILRATSTPYILSIGIAVLRHMTKHKLRAVVTTHEPRMNYGTSKKEIDDIAHALKGCGRVPQAEHGEAGMSLGHDHILKRGTEYDSHAIDVAEKHLPSPIIQDAKTLFDAITSNA